MNELKMEKKIIRGWVVISGNCYGFFKKKEDAEKSVLGTSGNIQTYTIKPATLKVII